MSLHESILVEMKRYIDDRSECAILSASAVAAATLENLSETDLDPRVEYLSLEQLKQMARKVLRGRFEPQGDDNPVYQDQGELFSGHLQERYPVQIRRGEDPVYKPLSSLTKSEWQWNVRKLARMSSSFLAHSDHLKAWGDSHMALLEANEASQADHMAQVA